MDGAKKAGTNGHRGGSAPLSLPPECLPACLPACLSAYPPVRLCPELWLWLDVDVGANVEKTDAERAKALSIQNEGMRMSV